MKCVLLLHLIWDKWNININSLFLAFSVTNPQELKGIYLKDVYINSYDLGTITKMHKQSLNVKAVFFWHVYSVGFLKHKSLNVKEECYLNQEGVSLFGNALVKQLL